MAVYSRFSTSRLRPRECHGVGAKVGAAQVEAAWQLATQRKGPDRVTAAGRLRSGSGQTSDRQLIGSSFSTRNWAALA